MSDIIDRIEEAMDSGKIVFKKEDLYLFINTDDLEFEFEGMPYTIVHEDNSHYHAFPDNSSK